MTKRHNVALVDDHHLMRTGLVNTVNAMGDYRVTLEAGNGAELVDRLTAMDLNGPDAPTIAVVDLNMPVMDGYATMRWLGEHAPNVLPLALTFDATDDAMVRAVHAGARGYVLKSEQPHVLRTALDSLVNTGYYYTQEMMAVHLRGTQEMRREELSRARVMERITERELEFLTLVCDEAELTYDAIAERMGVQRRTVDNYRSSLFEKFDL
ncbi:MAG: response regulator, partial [Flavobacteriales bacterium]